MPKGVKLTRRIKLRIVELHEEGLNRSAIKTRLGVTDWAITKALKQKEAKNEVD